MRVIAGAARRLQLKTIEGKDTRPTTDRIKETLFNILNPYIGGTLFLDLFSGSGAIGIEALSRGAKQGYFVEMNKRAAACINENLEHTKLDDKGEVLVMDVLSAINVLSGRGLKMDYIYMDPPYREGLYEQVLASLKASELVGEDTVIIVEAALKNDFSFLDEMGYHVTRVKEYKTNKHLFLQLAQ